MITLRSVALGVVADDPEFVGDDGGQRAGGDDGDGGCRRGAGQLGGASGGLAKGAERRRMIRHGGDREGQGRGVEGRRAGCDRQRLRLGAARRTTRLFADLGQLRRLVFVVARRSEFRGTSSDRPPVHQGKS